MCWPAVPSLPTFCRFCAICNLLIVMTTLFLHIYWYDGCLFSLWGVLTLDFLTITFLLPSLLIVSTPMRRAVGLKRTIFILQRLWNYFPAVSRLAMAFLSVYAVVLLAVFRHIPRRRVGNNYYVYVKEDNVLERITVTSEDYCRLERQDACSSSALLLCISTFSLTLFAAVYPKMSSRADTDVYERPGLGFVNLPSQGGPVAIVRTEEDLENVIAAAVRDADDDKEEELEDIE